MDKKMPDHLSIYRVMNGWIIGERGRDGYMDHPHWVASTPKALTNLINKLVTEGYKK